MSDVAALEAEVKEFKLQVSLHRSNMLAFLNEASRRYS